VGFLQRERELYGEGVCGEEEYGGGGSENEEDMLECLCGWM
jgi:hypothetical protein